MLYACNHYANVTYYVTSYDKKSQEREAIYNGDGRLFVFDELAGLCGVGKEEDGLPFNKKVLLDLQGVALIAEVVDQLYRLMAADGLRALGDDGTRAPCIRDLFFGKIGILLQRHRLCGNVLQHKIHVLLELVIGIGFRA